MAASIFAAQLAEILKENLDPSNALLIRELQQIHPFLLWGFTVVLAPVYEEILFRRVLFRRLWRDGWPYLGMCLSSLLFAFMHEPPIIGAKSFVASLPLWCGYTAMGFTFAWVYRKTNSLGAAILVHAINNGVAILVMLMADSTL